jgi:hypothetical protein
MAGILLAVAGLRSRERRMPPGTRALALYRQRKPSIRTRYAYIDAR